MIHSQERELHIYLHIEERRQVLDEVSSTYESSKLGHVELCFILSYIRTTRDRNSTTVELVLQRHATGGPDKHLICR